MTSPTLRVGLIGAGSVVSTLHAPLLKQFDDVAVKWVCDIDGDAAARVAQAFAIPAAHAELSRCGDVDAVLLAIPVGARAEAWRIAASRKWHVLCEKPPAVTVGELDEILQRMQEAARVVSFGFMRRFYAGVLCLRQLIAGGAFGEPIEIWAGEGGVQPRTGRGQDWYQLDRQLAGGGILIETGSHLLDQIVFVAGASGVHVEEYAQRSWRESPEFDARVYGRVSSERFADLPFSCVVSRSADVCNGIFVRYPRAVLALPPGPGALVELRDDRNRRIAHLQGTRPGATTSFQAFRDEWVAFLEQCRRETPPRPVEEHRMTRLSVAAIESCYGRASLAGSAELPAGARIG